MTVDGAPAERVARRARAALFQALGRDAELNLELASLQSGLRQGRWRLDRVAYLHYAGKPPEAPAAALATAVEWLWNRKEDLPASGRFVLVAEGRPVTLLWRKSTIGLAALAALPDFQKAAWFAHMPAGDAQVALAVPSGEVIYGRDRGRSPKTVRPAAETGLPWNVAITTAAGPEDGFHVRRRLSADPRTSIGGPAAVCPCYRPAHGS